jgi:hypothetical protein
MTNVAILKTTNCGTLTPFSYYNNKWGNELPHQNCKKYLKTLTRHCKVWCYSEQVQEGYQPAVNLVPEQTSPDGRIFPHQFALALRVPLAR